MDQPLGVTRAFRGLSLTNETWIICHEKLYHLICI
jgi:hypothetical protein